MPLPSVDIRNLIPQSLELREDLNPIVHIAPLSAETQHGIENGPKVGDAQTLLSSEHLQLLHREFLSPQQQQRDCSSRHPLWSSISSLIESQLSDELPKSPEGLSTTITVHIRQAATAVQNHWKGDIYEKSFRYLALALLRVRLAPNRFVRTEERRRVAAEGKSSGHAVRSGSISKSQWTRRARDLFNELAALTRKDMPDVKAGPRIEALLLKLRNLRKSRPVKREHMLQPIPSIEEQLRQAQYAAKLNAEDSTDSARNDGDSCMQIEQIGFLSEDEDEDEQDTGGISDESDEDEGDLYPEEDDEEHDIQAIGHHLEGMSNAHACEDEGQESQCGNDDNEGEDDDNEEEDDEDERESSGAQVKRLLTVVNTLVHSPTIKHAVNTNYVSKALSKTTKCTAKELRAIRDIANLLRPFAPKRVPTEHGYRAHTPCVALQAPMVLLAQATLQALGLHRYTRRLSPWPSAGSCIALQVSPAVLFEILCSSRPGQFDIRTESGHAITTVPDAARKENKASVLGAFFDMSLIHQQCREYHLEQANR